VVVYQQGNRRRRSIIILIVVTAVALITLDLRESGPVSGLQDRVRDVIEPVSGAVADVFSPVGDWIDGIANSASLSDENAELRRRLDEERGKLARAEAAIAENEELRRLLDLSFLRDRDAVTARVVGGAPGNFEYTVQVDAGSNQGVAQDMAVVTGAGLAGKVTDVSRSRATVVLLRDPRSGVEAKLQNGETGFINGRGDEELLRFNDIDPNAPVEVGDLVTTAGGDTSIFPSGIPIGRVAEVDPNRGGVQQEILVEPLVDFSRIDFVKVLQPPEREPPAEDGE
jgi:rod shape-determining protein MreC